MQNTYKVLARTIAVDAAGWVALGGNDRPVVVFDEIPNANVLAFARVFGRSFPQAAPGQRLCRF